MRLAQTLIIYLLTITSYLIVVSSSVDSEEVSLASVASEPGQNQTPAIAELQISEHSERRTIHREEKSERAILELTQQKLCIGSKEVNLLLKLKPDCNNKEQQQRIVLRMIYDCYIKEHGNLVFADPAFQNKMKIFMKNSAKICQELLVNKQIFEENFDKYFKTEGLNRYLNRIVAKLCDIYPYKQPDQEEGQPYFSLIKSLLQISEQESYGLAYNAKFKYETKNTLTPICEFFLDNFNLSCPESSIEDSFKKFKSIVLSSVIYQKSLYKKIDKYLALDLIKPRYKAEELICEICKSSRTNGGWAESPCGHFFHKDCLMSFYEISTCCFKCKICHELTE